MYEIADPVLRETDYDRP
ncbi:MAG: hypothetical protein MGAcid_05580 [uncultured Acidilobus sp. MG]|nr:MAG: hypothetical protein MGAcid_05580 [uncultured Acidilobus sp. MG]